MATQHPLSLGEVKRLAGNADTIRLRAMRDADLETPIGAFLRLDDGTTPAYLLESVEGGERLGRYSFLGIGPRRLLEVRDGRARIQDRPVGVVDYSARPAGHGAPRRRSARRAPRVPAAPPRRADRGHAPLHRRRRRRPRLRRGVDLRAHGPAPGRRPRGGTPRQLHRDRPRPRLRPPDPHAGRDRLAPHRRAAPGGALPDRRAGDLRGPRADGPSERRRDGRAGEHARLRRRRRVRAARDLPRARRLRGRGPQRQGRDRGRRGDPGRPRPPPDHRPPAPPGRHAARRDRPLSRAPPGQPQPVPLLRPDARRSRSSAPAPSSSSRSRATG